MRALFYFQGHIYTSGVTKRAKSCGIVAFFISQKVTTPRSFLYLEGGMS
jgi:hypothetical protein